MTKKDYEMLAYVFAEQWHECFGMPSTGAHCGISTQHPVDFIDGAIHAREVLVSKLCVALRMANTNFNSERFRAAALPEQALNMVEVG